MPKVTVIIPNYNHARFLPRRLASVLGQTFRDFEVIFLDDRSTDDSRAVFERHAAGDPRVRAIFNEENSGSPFKQWNRGLREAGGEYVWIAESDDFADERLLERLVALLDAHPKVGLAYSQSWIVDQDDTPIKTYERMNENLAIGRWSSDFVNDGRDECRRYLISQNVIPNASAVLLRKAAVDRAGPAPEHLKLGGDWLMWARILLGSDIAFVAEPLNYHRAHAGTVRERSFEDGRDIQESALIQGEIARRAGLPGRERARIARGLAWSWLIYRNGGDGLVKRSKFPGAMNRAIVRAVAGVHWSAIPTIARGLALEALRGVGLHAPLAALKRAVAPTRPRGT
jgi:hypothetical protein